MATYKEIKGTKIQSFSSDPANPNDGQIWYNTSTETLKVKKPSISAWATGGDLNTPRSGVAGAGTQTAALGTGYPATAGTGLTESYDGTAWTEVNDLNNTRGQGPTNGGGTQTSTLMTGGAPTPVNTGTLRAVESWNGTSWTHVSSISTMRYRHGASGSDNTSALVFAGRPNNANTELWDGTSWTEVNDMNTIRYFLGGVGTQTAALGFGGNAPPVLTAATESWNGTSWTEVNDLNTSRQMIAGAGSTTAAIGFGGYSSPTVVTDAVESWNGTSWTTVSSLTYASANKGGAGSSTAALAIGGYNPPIGENGRKVEEWTNSPGIETVSAS